VLDVRAKRADIDLSMPFPPLNGRWMRPLALSTCALATLAGAPGAAAENQLARGVETVGVNGAGGVTGSLTPGAGRAGLVRFDLRPLVRPLARATLRVFVRRGGRGLTVRRRAGTLAFGEALSAREGRLRPGRSYEFDVTAAIRRSGGRHVFVLTSGARGRIVLGAGPSVEPNQRPRLRMWLERPPWAAKPKPTETAGDGRSAQARRDLLEALGSVPEADGYRYDAVDDRGNRLDTLKIIQVGKSRYVGVHHTLIDGHFTVMVASSRNLIDWDHEGVLAGNGSQPTIADLGRRGFVIAYEHDAPRGIGLRFRHYRNLQTLFQGQWAHQFIAPLTLSRAAQGTPNIYGTSLGEGIDDSQIRVGLHYFRNGVVDRQATGTLRDFSLWHAQRQPFLDNRPLALGARGNIGDRDYIAFEGYDFNVHETEIVRGDWSSWRTYLYDFRSRSAHWLHVKTHGGSYAFGNPTVTEVTLPNGKRGLAITQFLFQEGAAPGEAGQLIYYREL
jgi:hypothetical protein